MKSIKDLFIKSDSEEENESSENKSESKIGFPVGETVSTGKPSESGSNNPYLSEIIEVYEKGLESINMPGYDFYDFYTAIKAAGAQNEAVYRMAFQMGKTMDASLTPQKLANDAEYYLSKISDVYQKYSDQGRHKLDGLASQLKNDKETLTNETNHIESEISKLKQQIQALESKLSSTKATLSKVDEKYKPQQDAIQQKLVANDQAMQISVKKLNDVKEGIVKFLK